MNNRITTDKLKQTAKPIGGAIAKINSHLKHVVEVTPESFLEMVTQPNGYSFTPAIFNGTRSNKNWKEQSVFALDYDSGITPDEVLAVFKDIGIVPNVLYYSFSDTPELRKFRLVFFLDTVITDKEDRDYIQKGLMSVVECDKACKDSARLYFGGIEGKVLNSDPIDYFILYNAVISAIITKDGGQTRNVRPLLSDNGDDINTPLKVAEVLRDNKVYISTQGNCKKPGSISLDLTEIVGDVLILNDFVMGEWLTYPQLLGLATNLHWVRGGLKFMKDTMDKWNSEGKTQYTENNYNLLKNIRKQSYKPMMLKNFSPYEEDHKYHNILDAHDSVGKIKVFSKRENITLEEATEAMTTKFKEVIESDDKNVTLFKLPTAIGKTRELTKLKGVTIALPTNALKDEVYERMEVPAVKTPALPEFSSGVSDNLLKLYNMGLVDLARKYITKVSKGRDEDAELAKQYLYELNKAYSSSHTVVTTHTRAMFSEFKHDTIIFDEDPIDNILEVKSTTVGDFVAVRGIQEELFDDSPFSRIIRELTALNPGKVTESELHDINVETMVPKMIDANIDTDLIGLLGSSYMMANEKNPNIIYYIMRKRVPEKKIIIMSASASTTIYKRLFNERFVAHDISNVEHKGKVIQHTTRSYSRASLESGLKDLNEKLDGNPTITFKEYAGKIKGGVTDMYFGNVSGYDRLKGKNINVVGTPHRNNAAYLLMAAELIEEATTLDMGFGFQRVDWNGFRFKFMAYSNKELRDIQLGMIEGDLIQAVGRARALREDCTVNLYSNLPLRVTTQFKF